MELLKLSNVALGSAILILILVAIAMGAQRVQTQARIQAKVISAIAKNLEAIVIFPNPVKGNKKITFGNLTADVQIQVFNLAGEKVFDVRNIEGRFSWDVRNFSGNKCASGIYLCIIENKRGEKKIKRIAVIR